MSEGQPDVATWAQGVLDEYGQWVADMLGVPQQPVKQIVMKEMDHPAETQDGVIYLDPGWFKEHPQDRGAILHEYTHILTSGTSASSKKNEALADVARMKLGMGYKGWEPNDLTRHLASLTPDELQSRVHNWLGSEGDQGLYPTQASEQTATLMRSQGYSMPPSSPINVNPPSGQPQDQTQGGPDYTINWDQNGNMYKDYTMTPSSLQGMGNYANEIQDMGEWYRGLSNEEWNKLPPTDRQAVLDKLRKYQRDLNKEAKNAPNTQQPYAPFGWLEPTRRTGEEDYLKQSADLYFQIWGVAPPPGYLEKQISSGLNFYEMFDQERKKPAFQHTAYYRDQTAQMAQQVGQALGMRP